MLKVQIMIGTVEVDLMNGSSQSRYHGYTTGAHKSDAAMGHNTLPGHNQAVSFVMSGFGGPNECSDADSAHVHRPAALCLL